MHCVAAVHMGAAAILLLYIWVTILGWHWAGKVWREPGCLGELEAQPQRGHAGGPRLRVVLGMSPGNQRGWWWCLSERGGPRDLLSAASHIHVNVNVNVNTLLAIPI